MLDIHKSDPKEFYSQLMIIYVALVAGVILFGAVAFFIQNFMGLEFEEIFPFEVLYGVAVYVLFAFFISEYLYKKRLKSIEQHMDLHKKLEHYKGGNIVRFALIEGAALITGMGYMLTGHYQYFVLMGVAAGYFLHIRPAKDKLIETLNLSYADQHKLGFQ